MLTQIEVRATADLGECWRKLRSKGYWLRREIMIWYFWTLAIPTRALYGTRFISGLLLLLLFTYLGLMWWYDAPRAFSFFALFYNCVHNFLPLFHDFFIIFWSCFLKLFSISCLPFLVFVFLFFYIFFLFSLFLWLVFFIFLFIFSLVCTVNFKKNLFFLF